MQDPNRSGLIVATTWIAITGACNFDPAPNDPPQNDAMTMLPSDAGQLDVGPADAGTDAPGNDADVPDAAPTPDMGVVGDAGPDGGVPVDDGGAPVDDAGIVPADCGDGTAEAPEECDDGDLEDGDGCNSSCSVENGWLCFRQAPSRCFLADEITYVNGDRPGCPITFSDGSQLAPHCRIQEGADDDDGNVVVIAEGTYPEELRLSENVELVADGRVTVGGFTGLALEVRNAGAVVAYGLQFESAQSGAVRVHENASQATLVECEIGPSGGIGVWLDSDAMLTLERSYVHDNDEGGLLLESVGGYRVENSVIVNNGASNSEFGGVRVRAFSAVSSFVNNTIAENRTSNGSGAAAGIECEVPDTSVVNSIVWDNERNSGPSSISSNCAAEHCILGPGGTIGGTNLDQDPLFEDDNLFRIGPESPARSIANATIAPAVDFDGTRRPVGPGMDLGAHESP